MKSTLLIICMMIILSITAFGQRQDVVDDGFTWFESYAVSENIGVNGAPVAMGWTLKYWVRVIGNYPDGSGLNFVVSKAGRKVFSTRCETYVYRKTANDVDESFMRTAECWQGKSVTKETGKFDVKVFVVNGNTRAEKLVRTYKIDVHSIARVQGGQGKGFEPPVYIIDRHNEAAVGFIFLRPTGYIPYFDVRQRPERSGENLIEFHYSLSPSEEGVVPPHGEVACRVDGRPVPMPGPMPYATQAVSKYEFFHQEIYQDRLAPRYKAGLPYEEKIRFQMMKTSLPITWRKTRENRPALEDFKGNWECTFGKGNVVWRTIRFRVGADGMPELHPEQRGNINLGYNTFLVDMEIPPGGSMLDGRLNGPSTSLFYGQPWTSAEGKSMAARVPTKGNPFPRPSNKRK
ncbi:MAG: hypothetical protein R2682_00860 [Pyrinomonadaceae bacterium]